MEKGLKIAVIGGGSSYTPELVEGFINRHHELPVRELWLVDIPEGEEKLSIVGELARRMVIKAGIDMTIYLTLDRRQALAGADFVTTQFRVGLLAARQKDEAIPLKYGVIGQETNGPGGLFKALRTIPVILEITKDIEELCPAAWLVNFTNPAGMITEAVLRHSNIKKVVGLCNVPIGMKMDLAEVLEVEADRLEIQFAGLNHMVYGLDVFLDGVSIKEKALAAASDPGKQTSMKNIAALGWEPDFIKGIGVLPCPYHRYYYKTDEMLAEELEAFKTTGTRADVVKGVETELFDLYKNVELQTKPEQLEKRGGAYYSEAACSLINSIYNNKQDVQPVNTKNGGAIAGIPYDSAVEVNCIITKEGPKPITVGELPAAVNGLVQQIKSFERTAVEAAVSGDYYKALTAMAINPLVPSDTIAKHLLDDMLEAHKDYLPAFFHSEKA